ncbi:uncharacterized protein BX664DRAFT_290960 [Halteromyces radiatus]|uniref:uncharacterized protein n=1 Tax=Halteromyces radiatus TaxID=101107 RepID=UPI00221F33E8|nr:uncharacterized protein BX664DRAFT_290960 [Halteromyces radiatus]KAI8096221.1 hypothetical protein BX664DRAFT_290960 [Halteromyces radiatus]
MLPVYSHCNESCIDPMLLSLSPGSDIVPTTPTTTTTTNTTPTTSNTTTSRTMAKSSLGTTTETIRHSIVSHYSTTTASGSTRRDSFGSSDGDKEDLQTRRWSAESGSLEHVLSPSSPTSCSSSTLQPSSRFLLSGATSSETFRQQELLRFYPSSTTPSRRIKTLSNPFVTMPSLSIQPPFEDSATTLSGDDAWCMSVKVALENASCKDWLYKYEFPTFAFARSWKRRYIILSGQTVYVFKSNKATNPTREHFLLTDDTLIFVTEDFKKKECVIEMRKPLYKWYLRCESVTQMKYWLEAMKKVVACLKLGYRGPLTSSVLSSLVLTDDARLLTTRHTSQQPSFFDNKKTKRSSTPVTFPFNSSSSSKRQSLAQIPHWEKTLPPQMPPPTSLPPPPPSSPSRSSSPTFSRSTTRPSSAIFRSFASAGTPPTLSTVSESLLDLPSSS